MLQDFTDYQTCFKQLELFAEACSVSYDCIQESKDEDNTTVLRFIHQQLDVKYHALVMELAEFEGRLNGQDPKEINSKYLKDITVKIQKARSKRAYDINDRRGIFDLLMQAMGRSFKKAEPDNTGDNSFSSTHKQGMV